MKKQNFWQDDNVKLRLIKERDSEVFLEMLTDTKLRISTEGGLELPATLEKAEGFIMYTEDVVEKQNELWFTIMDLEEEIVGFSAINHVNTKDGTARFQITILPEYRRKGYAKSATSILLKYAFDERRLHKVSCFLPEENEDGKQFLTAMGFAYEATRKEVFHRNGKFYNQCHFGITDVDVKQQKAHQPFVPKEATQSEFAEKIFAKVREERPYFWQMDNLVLRNMRIEDYIDNREMQHSYSDAIHFNNVLNLPYELEEREVDEEECKYSFFEMSGEVMAFGVADLEDNYLGIVNLQNADYKNGTFSLGYYFLPWARKKGYAVRSVALVMQYAFYELRLNKMNLYINSDNEDSIKLVEKLGCNLEGVWRDHLYYEGSYQDTLLYGISKREMEEKFK